jgi:hypothetical protein
VEAAREVPVADGITATIRASGLRLFVLVLALRASAWVRARLQRYLPWGPRCCSSATRSGGRCRCCRSGRRRAARRSSVAPQAPPPIEWGCSYLRRWNRSSVCNGTLNASVFVHCGCQHVCSFGTEPCFFPYFRALRLAYWLSEPLHQA